MRAFLFLDAGNVGTSLAPYKAKPKTNAAWFEVRLPSFFTRTTTFPVRLTALPLTATESRDL
jgi:hypothetical protein